MKPLRALIFLCLLVFSAFAGLLGALPAPSGGLLRLAVPDRLVSLDPACAAGIGERQAAALIAEPLFAFDAKGVAKPRLLLRAESEEDGLLWHLWLDPQRRMSDGAPLSSSDVKASLSHAIRLSTAPLLSDIHGAREVRARKSSILTGVTLLTPYELTIRLERASEDLPALLADPRTAILPARQAENTGCVGWPVGSGPFKIAEWENGEKGRGKGVSRLMLHANPDYAGGRPALDRLLVLAVESAFDEEKLLEAGLIDASLYSRLPSARYARHERSLDGVDVWLWPVKSAPERAFWQALLPCRDALTLFEKRAHAPLPDAKPALFKANRTPILPLDEKTRALKEAGAEAVGVSCQGFALDVKGAKAAKAQAYPQGLLPVLGVFSQEPELVLLAERAALLARGVGLPLKLDKATTPSADARLRLLSLPKFSAPASGLPEGLSVYRLLPALSFVAAESFGPPAGFDRFGLYAFAALSRRLP